MAAVDPIPMWAILRYGKAIQQFIDLGFVKSGQENVDMSADFDISRLDENKMEAHILDCIAARRVIQQQRVNQGKPLILRGGEQPLTFQTQAASNRIFAAAVHSFLGDELILPGAAVPLLNEGKCQLVRAFPDKSKLTDGRYWMPLHWAVVLDSVTVEDTKQVYSSDATALQRYHLQGTDLNNMGFTPAHLLCMQEPTIRNETLIQYFSVASQGRAFTMSASYPNRDHDPLLYGFSALHAHCALGQPDEKILQKCLQLDSSQTKKLCNEIGLTPLGYLCANGSCSDRLIGCLLKVDDSADVVGSGIRGCLKSTDDSCVLERVDMLLKANPEAAKYHTVKKVNLLHFAARYAKGQFQLHIDIMQRILSTHKDAVREKDSDDWLPVHEAARYSTVDVMEFLLGLHPESALVVTNNLINLLHLAIADTESTTSVMEAKVRFLCSRYPAMMLQMSGNGSTPLHAAICIKNIPAVLILCEAGGQELIRVPIAHPTDADYALNGWLPLFHALIAWNAESLRDSLLSQPADCFRLLLRSCPEAAGIEGGGGIVKSTPYQLAVDKDLPPYYLRLLLRAAPDLNRTELHRLNYAERRMAMFLAFAAQSTNIDLLLPRWRDQNKDLLMHVISFL